jgi:Flp pilus assembly protein TadG
MLAEVTSWLRGDADDRQRGAIAIEFAVAAPMLITLVLGVVDYGALMNTSALLRGATRAGAEYAKANWNNPSVTNVTTAAEQQVCGFLGVAFASGSCSPVTPGVSSACYCPGASNPTTAVACPGATGSNPCAANADPRLIVNVTVTATQNFTPMFSWARFAFPKTVTAATTIRTQ